MNYQPLTLGEVLEERTREYKDKIYLLFKDEEISYEQFNRTVNRVARGLMRLGIRQGSHVGIHLPNCPQFLYSVFALARIGASIVPTNTALRSNELSFILDHADAEAIITTSAFAELVKTVQESCPRLKQVIYIDGERSGEGSVTWQDLLADDDSALNLENAPGPGDVIALMYTSGTTALPKGAMLTHQCFVEGARWWMWAAGFTSKDRTLLIAPLFHVNALIYNSIGSMLFGGSVVVMESFNPAQYLDNLRHYGATHINFAGTLMAMLMSQPEKPTDPENPVRVVSSAMGSPELNAAFEKRYQIKVLMYYCLTESVIGLCTPIVGNPVKVGALGWPSPSLPFPAEAKVVDDNGQEVPVGKVGEIILHTPAIMLGYYKQPDKTEEVIKDGWIYTGDLAYMDEDGCFWFVDRKKDVIKWKGENVSSQEVEAVIGNHPKVESCAVIGVPDPIALEEVKAYVRLKPGENEQTVSPEELIAWCKERMASFKVPRYFEYRTEKFPTSIGGAKILKRELKLEKEDLTKGCYDRRRGKWL